MGVELILIDEVPENSGVERIIDPENPVWHWEFGKEIISQLENALDYKLDGAIEISSFQCGCDAVLKEFVEKELKKKSVPFLYLLIDEHTAEAGIQTRLEAFIDTLK